MSSLNLEKFAKIVEKYMLDEVVISRPGAETVDANTLLITKATTEVYSGEAMIAPQGTPSGTMFAGGHVTELMTEIGLPRTSDPMLPNDLVTVVTSVNNPGMEGHVFVVINEVDSTFFTHRRLMCRLRELAQ